MGGSVKETEVTAKIVKILNSNPACYARKHHSGKFSSGDPDIAGVAAGRAFFIETKVTGGELTKLQADQLEKWRTAGAHTTLVIYDKSSRSVKSVELHDSETWDQFTGHDKLDELWSSTARIATPLRDSDFSTFVDFYARPSCR